MHEAGVAKGVDIIQVETARNVIVPEGFILDGLHSRWQSQRLDAVTFKSIAAYGLYSLGNDDLLQGASAIDAVAAQRTDIILRNKVLWDGMFQFVLVIP